MKRTTRGWRRDQVCAEPLERRVLMDGNVKVAVDDGNLVVTGDRADNSVIITRTAAGKVRVAGVDDTKVNGGSSREFSAAFDDLEILMRQGGEDAVAVRGALRVAGDLDVVMGNGQVVVEGSSGAVEIGEDLVVRGGSRGDVVLRNDVIVRGRADIQTGGAVTAAAALSTVPAFDRSNFGNSLDIDNPYFPLVPGTRYEYEEKSVDDETGQTVTERIVVEVTDQTKTILGVKNRVLRDRVYVDGRLIEDTFDWHAQDDDGNVWYFGEETTDFEYDDDGNLIDTSTEASWKAGVNGATPGVIMLARPRAGDRYYQEFEPGGALDFGIVVATGQTVRGPAGTFRNVVRTEDINLQEPSGLEHKFYAPGVGMVQELGYDRQTGEVEATLRLVSLTRNGSPITRVVPPNGFSGTNATGRQTGRVQVRGESLVRAGGPVLLMGVKLLDEIEIFAGAEVTVVDSLVDDLTIRAEDSVAIWRTTAAEEVSIRGNVDVAIFGSTFQDKLTIVLGAGGNELAVKNSSFGELFADGGGGKNEFDDRGGNDIDDLDLTRFDV